MNAKANYVRSRLSFRSPQAESLEILQELTDVHERYPICADVEADFVAEPDSAIYMVETKSQRDMNTEDVAKKTEVVCGK